MSETVNTRVSVIGGSGYAGSHIVAAAAKQGLDIRSFSRGEVAEPLAGVRYETGSIAESADRARMLEGADVVVVAVAPRGNMQGRVRPLIAELAAEAAAAGVRLGVIGGAGSLLNVEGGIPLVDTPEFAEEYKPEAQEMAAVLEDLRATPEALDWFLVSPAGDFGPWVPGDARGVYRVGGDVLLKDADGTSAIGGADFGLAIADELANPRHHRARFTVAY